MDFTLGAVGCGLATVSAGFGLYMVVHGPPPGSFGTSKDFTVFAQLAPRRLLEPKPRSTPRSAPRADDLDLEATASIPRRPTTSGTEVDEARGDKAQGEEAMVLPAIALRSADRDEATIVIGDRAMVVRVGDIVPGAGEVLTITSSPRPQIITSRGRIIPSQPN